MSVACPTCDGSCSFVCNVCMGHGCYACAEAGRRPCATCGGAGDVDEPLHCPKCNRHHGGPLRGWGLDELHELRVEPCDTCSLSGPQGVPADLSSGSGAGSGGSLPGPAPSPDRLDSVRRRWDADSKPCGRCGCDVLWRHEDGRRVPLNVDATEHACPTT